MGFHWPVLVSLFLTLVCFPSALPTELNLCFFSTISNFTPPPKQTLLHSLQYLFAANKVDFVVLFFWFMHFQLRLNFGSKKAGIVSIIFEDLSRNSVFFRTKVKPYFQFYPPPPPAIPRVNPWPSSSYRISSTSKRRISMSWTFLDWCRACAVMCVGNTWVSLRFGKISIVFDDLSRIQSFFEPKWSPRYNSGGGVVRYTGSRFLLWCMTIYETTVLYPMRCCWSAWPEFCLCCCYQPLSVASQQSWFWARETLHFVLLSSGFCLSCLLWLVFCLFGVSDYSVRD